MKPKLQNKNNYTKGTNIHTHVFIYIFEVSSICPVDCVLNSKIRKKTTRKLLHFCQKLKHTHAQIFIKNIYTKSLDMSKILLRSILQKTLFEIQKKCYYKKNVITKNSNYKKQLLQKIVITRKITEKVNARTAILSIVTISILMGQNYKPI